MSEPPVQVIRDESPHKVEMSEHSRVAASKTAEVGAPSVRKVLASPEAEVSESLPAQEHRVLAPDELTRPANGNVLVPPPLAAGAAPVLQIPEGQVSAAASALEIPGAHDKVLATLDIPAGEASERNSLAIPAGQGADVPTLDIPVGESAATPELNLTPASDAPSARLDPAVIKTMLSELNVAASNETLQEQLGGPDAVWVEMDYPARIIKLKIENDKVRDKLDTLERALGSPADGA